MRKRNRPGYQKLENRVCLAVSAVLSDSGSLRVSGDADGDVSIVATDTGINVTDNGVDIGSFEEASSIRVIIDRGSETAADNNLSIDLGDQSVDFVFATLGDGDNRFELSGNLSVERVLFIGGSGNDTMNVDIVTERIVAAWMQAGDDVLSVDADANFVLMGGGVGSDTINLAEGTSIGNVIARLGHGDNAANFHGEVNDTLSVRGGSGVDVIELSATSTVGQQAHFILGSGDNSLNLEGAVDGTLVVKAANGTDMINVADTATVAGRARFNLGGGANDFSIDGNFFGTLFLQGSDGGDVVDIADSALVEGDLTIRLGEDTNVVTVAGNVGGDLFVTSQNADDVFEVTGVVTGTTTLTPGEQVTNGNGSHRNYWLRRFRSWRGR
jgi:hypothetical protein